VEEGTKGFPTPAKYTDELWQRGMIYPGGYSYHVKVCGQPSQFGIEGGRVSKLTVWCMGRKIINYDRGWDVKPRFFHLKRRAVLMSERQRGRQPPAKKPTQKRIGPAGPPSVEQRSPGRY